MTFMWTDCGTSNTITTFVGIHADGSRGLVQSVYGAPDSWAGVFWGPNSCIKVCLPVQSTVEASKQTVADEHAARIGT